MRFHATPERRQVVAALEHRHDASFTQLIGQIGELAGDPGVIGVDPAELADVVIAMRIEACRNEQHLGFEVTQRRQPGIGHRIAQRLPTGVGRKWHIEHVLAECLLAAVGIQLRLKGRDHQDSLVTGQDVLTAIAVMNIEIDQGNALHAELVEGMADADRHVVEKAKAHRAAALGMVTGWAHIAEGTPEFALPDQFSGQHRGTGRMHRGIDRLRIHRGIGVELPIACLGRQGDQLLDIAAVMSADKLLDGGRRRLEAFHDIEQTPHQQPIGDDRYALRAFRMACAHLVAHRAGV